MGRQGQYGIGHEGDLVDVRIRDRGSGDRGDRIGVHPGLALECKPFTEPIAAMHIERNARIEFDMVSTQWSDEMVQPGVLEEVHAGATADIRSWSQSRRSHRGPELRGCEKKCATKQ